MMEVPLVALYIIDGVIGALIWVLTPPLEKPAKTVLARLLEGAIIGYVIFVLGLPNHVTAISGGYMGLDIIKQILEERFRKGET
jgi:uncharacterized membrane protein